MELVLPPKRQRRRGERVPNPEGDPLFEALRACRRDLAQEAGVPPYVVFHDSTLREMAELKPTTLGTPANLSGVADAHPDRYGPAFVPGVAAHAGYHGCLPLSTNAPWQGPTA